MLLRPAVAGFNCAKLTLLLGWPDGLLSLEKTPSLMCVLVVDCSSLSCSETQNSLLHACASCILSGAMSGDMARSLASACAVCKPRRSSSTSTGLV